MTCWRSRARIVVLLVTVSMTGAVRAQAAPLRDVSQQEIMSFLDWGERDLSFVPAAERLAFVVRALELMGSAADVLTERGLKSPKAAARRKALSLRTRELAEAAEARRPALARAAFAEGAALMRALTAKVSEGPRPHESRLAALARAGRGIDIESPLWRQPQAIQHYFEHAAASIRVLSRATLRAPN